jgi:hypothetical protein
MLRTIQQLFEGRDANEAGAGSGNQELLVVPGEGVAAPRVITAGEALASLLSYTGGEVDGEGDEEEEIWEDEDDDEEGEGDYYEADEEEDDLPDLLDVHGNPANGEGDQPGDDEEDDDDVPDLMD